MPSKLPKISGKNRKFERQKVLRQLLTDGKDTYDSQKSLAEALKKKGFSSANQATVNRDLHELGIERTGNYYGLPRKTEEQIAQEELATLLSRRKGEIHTDISIFLIKVQSGFAHVTAAVLKEAFSEEAFHTICNDDSILVITPNKPQKKKEAPPLADKITALVQRQPAL